MAPPPTDRPLWRTGGWAERAACAGSTDPTWVTEPAKITPDAAHAVAKVCNGCPVIDACRDHHRNEVAFEGFAAGRRWWSRRWGQ